MNDWEDPWEKPPPWWLTAGLVIVVTGLLTVLFWLALR